MRSSTCPNYLGLGVNQLWIFYLCSKLMLLSNLEQILDVPQVPSSMQPPKECYASFLWHKLQRVVTNLSSSCHVSPKENKVFLKPRYGFPSQ